MFRRLLFEKSEEATIEIKLSYQSHEFQAVWFLQLSKKTPMNKQKTKNNNRKPTQT